METKTSGDLEKGCKNEKKSKRFLKGSVVVSFYLILMVSPIITFTIPTFIDDGHTSFQDLVDYGHGNSAMKVARYAFIAFTCCQICIIPMASCSVHNKCVMFLYFSCLLVYLGTLIAAVIIYWKYGGEIVDYISIGLTKSITIHKEGNNIAYDWDKLQTSMRCCGSNGPEDYSEVKFKKPAGGIPAGSNEVKHIDMFVPNTCCISRYITVEQKNYKQCQLDAVMYIAGNITSSQFLEIAGCVKNYLDRCQFGLKSSAGISSYLFFCQIISVVTALVILACCDQVQKAKEKRGIYAILANITKKVANLFCCWCLFIFEKNRRKERNGFKKI